MTSLIQWFTDYKQENKEESLQSVLYDQEQIVSHYEENILKQNPGYTVDDIRDHPVIWSLHDPKELRSRIRLLSRYNDAVLTARVINRKISQLSPIVIRTESDTIGDQTTGLVQPDKMETMETLLDLGGDEAKEVSGGDEYTFSQGQDHLSGLEEFFHRPVEIATFTAALGATISNVYPIWDMYTSQPSVRAKLRNYSYFKATLHVRIVISGSPFHFGRILASYQPYPERNQNLAAYTSIIAALPAARYNLLCYLSQSKGAVSMDIKANKPVDMEIPFISTKPMHRLYNSNVSVIAAGSSYEDLEEAGSLYLYSINDVNAVNVSASPIAVQIYAWATDVCLGPPTATQIEITTESDEFERGPVEKISSTIATVSGVLTAYPPLAPFAKASEMVFGGISSLASLFGWSRPVKTDDPLFVKNRPFANGAQTIGSETVKRITFDPKQELTVGPQCCGIDDDELTVLNLATRESLFRTFVWSPSDTNMVTSLFKCRVHPQLDAIERGVTKDFYQPSPMSFAILPFEYWRGKIIFRLEIVCSAYHRGKLAVMYEPNLAQMTLITANVATNKNYLKIIDIQQTQSIEFCVDWAFPRAWARTFDAPNSIFNSKVFSTISSGYEYVNGFINVVPFTQIQSPDNSAVSVNVYVRAEDLMGNVLTQEHLPTERIMTESSDYETKSDELVSCIPLNYSSATTDHISDLHFGEQPLSLRSALKRYTTSSKQSIGAGLVTDVALKVENYTYPSPLPIYGASTTEPIHLFGYLRYAFLGVKGSVRKRVRFLYSENAEHHPLSRVMVTLQPNSSTLSQTIAWQTSYPDSTLDGTVGFVPFTNGGVEFEVPFYSNNLFVYSFADDLIGTGNSVNDQSEIWNKNYTVTMDTVQAPEADEIEETACGEDFNFLRFCGAPNFSSNPVV